MNDQLQIATMLILGPTTGMLIYFGGAWVLRRLDRSATEKILKKWREGR